MSVYETFRTVSKEKEHFNESCTNNTCEKEHLGCSQSEAYHVEPTVQLLGSSFDISQGTIRVT